jgi:aryl-alcohol dehydrogenase-like predicted oxidoreductase
MPDTSPYTNIPGTHLQPYRICLGTVPFGSTMDDAASFRLLDAYLDAGGNFIDTAKIYADWLPNEGSTSEKAIGRWMRARKNRSRIILATKGAHPDWTSMDVARLAPVDIRFDINASLQHLQTDVIDLYWLHRDDPTLPVEEIVDVLNEQVQAGKIRYFGCSNWHASRIQAANEYAVRSGQQAFIADQPLWNLAHINLQAISDPTLVVMNDDLFDYHLHSGLTMIPYTSQANGLFQKMADGRFHALGDMQQQMYAGPENQQRLERILALSQQTGLTLTQIILGYLLSQPFTTIPIIGSPTLAQLHDSLSAAQLVLSEDQILYLSNPNGR